MAWPSTLAEEGKAVYFEQSDGLPSLDNTALRAELCEALEMVIAALTPQQRSFLLRHVVHGDTYVAIAEETGSTPDAVRMVVKRACKRLRISLEQEGFDADEVSDYLAIISSPPRKKSLLKLKSL